jgi:hypothetical protein
MSLIVRAGGRTSNSFITVAEANDYIREDIPDAATEWDALSDEQKEFRLELAAQAMGYLPLRGRTVFCGQSLCFPRTSQDNVHIIPEAVKRAQSQVAYSVIHRSLAQRTDIQDSSLERNLSSVSLGGILTVTFGKGPINAGNVLDQITKGIQFPVYLRLKHFLSQVRGSPVPTSITCSTTTSTT